MVFPELSWEPRVYSQVTAGMDTENSFLLSDISDTCLVTRDISGISSRLGRAIRTIRGVRQENQGPFLVTPVILRFLSVFTKSQASSPFEAMNSAHLSMCQK